MKSKHYLLLIVGLILSTWLMACGNDTPPETSESTPIAPTALPTNTAENTPIAEAPTALPTNTAQNTPIAEAPTALPTNTAESASDIYSLGIMLYELVTGPRPFSGNSAQSIMWKQLYDAVPPPRSLNPTLPEALEQVILKMLAKHPDDRYQQVAHFLKDLEQAIAQEPMPLRPPHMPAANSKKKSRGRGSFLTSRTLEGLPTEPMTRAEQETLKWSSWQEPTVPEAFPTERRTSHLAQNPSPFWQQIPSWVWLAVVVFLLLVIGSMLLQ